MLWLSTLMAEGAPATILSMFFSVMVCRAVEDFMMNTQCCGDITEAYYFAVLIAFGVLLA